MFWIWLVSLAVAWATWKILQLANFWRRHNVTHSDSFGTIITDTISLFTQQRSFGDIILKVYRTSPNSRYYGTFQFFNPSLFLRDPELIKQITVKDFDNFVDHRTIVPDDIEPLLAKNLLNLKGQRWRDIRTTLSPAFTSSKMKGMFTLMSECAERLVNHFVSDDRKVVNVELKDLYTRYANDVIATCAFGVTCDSVKDRDNEFYTMGADLTNFKGIWRNFKFFAIPLCPGLFKFFGITLFPKTLTEFFTNAIKETMGIRKKQNIVRPDMIHLLMEARKWGASQNEDTKGQKETGFSATVEGPKQDITDEDIVAQALVFFFAGFETVSTALSFVSYELAVNPQIQERLTQEIEDVLRETQGKVTYDCLLKMKYLDMVISETFRKWPPNFGTDRVCTSSFVIEPKSEGEKPVVLSPGDGVFVPIYGLHRDEKYFPNPDRFDPERFSEENKHSIVPYSYLPFGVGPRNCIGLRFALLEMKALLVNLLKNCQIVVTEKTDIPLKISKKQITLTPENGFWVGFKPKMM